MRSRMLLIWVAAGLVGHSSAVVARSTAMARFSCPAVAGPEIEQSIRLYLRCFPGDGEAILRARLTGDSEVVELRSARSRLGGTRVSGDRMDIDYTDRPLSTAAVDTLDLQLVWHGRRARYAWTVEIFSTLGEAESAHRSTVALEMRPPVSTACRLTPHQVFAGENLELRLVVRNQDTEGRSLTAARLNWPVGVSAPHAKVWTPSLGPEATDTLRLAARISPDVDGLFPVSMRVDTREVLGSPVEPLEFLVLPLPRVRVSAADAVVVGEVASIDFEWFNPGAAAMALEAVRLDLGAAFHHVRAQCTSHGDLQPEVVATEDDVRVTLRGVGELAGGERIRVTVQARPRRLGAHNWRGLAQPPGRTSFIDLHGDTEVRVVRTAAAAGSGTEAAATVVADLESVQHALRCAWRDQAADLPIPAGASIRLVSRSHGDRDWLVADVLMDELMARGYPVRLSQEATDERSGMVLKYRIVAARVVYTAAGGGWRFWQRGATRHALADVLLQLEDDEGELVWSRQVRAFVADHVAAADREVASSGDLVGRTVIEQDNRIIERGLSAGIISALAYIFFIL